MQVRRALVVALAIGCVAGGVAAARSVSTGTTAKMSRKSTFLKMSAYWVGGYGDQVDLVIYPAFIEEGDEFDVVDAQGYLARVRVSSVRKTNEGCPKFTYMRAEAKWLEKPSRDSSYSTRIAFGPLPKNRERHKKARLFEAAFGGGNAKDIKGLPPPGASQGLSYAVDLDGDGDVDLARYIYDCTGGHNTRYNATSLGCVDDWVRDGTDSWVLGDQGKFQCH